MPWTNEMNGEMSREDADIVTSSDAYARRFAGSVGKWLLKVQENAVLRCVKDRPGASVLDVGGAHGQISIPLAAKGYRVTVAGSAESCWNRISHAATSGFCKFVVAAFLNMPFGDGAFEIVASVRLLTHAKQWRRLIAEMCRVSDSSVILDYPCAKSFNQLYQQFFPLKYRLEGDTRPWHTLRDAEIIAELRSHGFQPVSRTPLYFLPVVAHRALRCAPLSSALEAGFKTIGLTRIWGSPIILEARRSNSVRSA